MYGVLLKSVVSVWLEVPLFCHMAYYVCGVYSLSSGSRVVLVGELYCLLLLLTCGYE